jgi:hypothetical protein
MNEGLVQSVTIEPVRKQLKVSLPVEQAFELFSRDEPGGPWQPTPLAKNRQRRASSKAGQAVESWRC